MNYPNSQGYQSQNYYQYNENSWKWENDQNDYIMPKIEESDHAVCEPIKQKKIRKKGTCIKMQAIPYQEAVLTQINQPINLQGNPQIRRKYQIKLEYYLKSKPGKIRQYTLRFGKRSQEDFIDKQNQKIKLRRMLQFYDHRENPFHHGFWSYHLLNNTDNIVDSYNIIISKHQQFGKQ